MPAIPAGSASNRTGNKMPPIAYHKKFTTEAFPTDSELITDETISSTNTGTDFDVPNPTSNFHERTNHLNGTAAAGENVLSFDGHVSWRKWGSITTATPIQQYSMNAAWFWVVNP
jgi:hypothetical protein